MHNGVAAGGAGEDLTVGRGLLGLVVRVPNKPGLEAPDHQTQLAETVQTVSPGAHPASARATRTARRCTPQWLRRYSLCVVLGDLAMGAIAASAAVLLMWTSVRTPLFWLLFPFFWVALLALGRTYEHRYVGNGNEEYRRLFLACVCLAALVGTTAYALQLDLARGVVVVAVPVASVLSLLWHYVARHLLHRARREGRCLQRVVVIGRERSVAELVRTLRREPQAGFRVVAACVDRSRDPSIEGVPVLGSASDVLDTLKTANADSVVLTAWSDVSQAELRTLSWQLEGSRVSVLVAPRLADVSGPRVHIRPVAGLPLLNVEEPEFTGVRRVLKGAMDRLLALSALVVLGPLLVGTAIAVRATSSGPAFFRQLRVGRHGRQFVMHKFRSMRITAEEELAALLADNEHGEGPLFKIRRDPRVTPVGRLLRRYSLDELPQLIDVVRGRMSLVGPRPPLPAEVAQYPEHVHRRLLVKPGLTGLWQVSGRSDLTWDESVRLDLYYVENWSLAWDLTIIMKTIMAVLKRSGAY